MAYEDALLDLVQVSEADVIEDGIESIALDGVYLKLVGKIHENQLATFQRKFTIGDYTHDSNDLLSSVIWSDLTGGHGILDMNEGSDTNRTEYATAYTRYANQVSKPPYVFVDSSSTVGDVLPLGDLYIPSLDTMAFVLCIGTSRDVYLFLPGTSDGEFDAADLSGFTGISPPQSLPAKPKNKGVAFRGTMADELLYVPLGGAGYATVSNTGVVNVPASSENFEAFTLWDTRIIGVMANGTLWESVNGTTWAEIDTTIRLSRSYDIRNVITFFDRSDRPTVYIITDRDIWQLDANVPELIRIDHGWPAHPRFARGSCVWRGNLYISVGMGVWRYTAGSWQPVGLDNGAGLPSLHSGYISSLEAGYNGLYATVVSGRVGGHSSIQEWNGTGWHAFWDSNPTDLATGTAPEIGWAHVSSGNGKYNLFVGGTQRTVTQQIQLLRITLPIEGANPLARRDAGQWFSTATRFVVQLPWFDAGLEAYTKIGNTIALTTKYMTGGHEVVVEYRTDDTQAFTELGRTSVSGRMEFEFGALLRGVKQGVAYERIQIRYVILNPLLSHDSPIVRSLSHSFLKVVAANYAFDCSVDCRSEFAGNSPASMLAHVDRLSSEDRWVSLVVRGLTYKVFVSQTSGDRETGQDERGVRQVSIVQIPAAL